MCKEVVRLEKNMQEKSSEESQNLLRDHFNREYPNLGEAGEYWGMGNGEYCNVKKRAVRTCTYSQARYPTSRQ